jgi:amidase
MNLEELTTTQIQGAYLRAELTAHDLTAWYLTRIESLDRSGPELNSINALNERALHEASEFDRRLRSTGSLRGPMDGIPVVIKDQIETAGIRTTFGSAATRLYMPAQDATVVKLLRDAGAIILAKTSMADFGASWFSASSYSGLTKNPYALDHDSGGSSGGTAVAVAANLAAVGVGGDTGGSVRLPASFCNIVGLRVTPGLISRRGISPLVAPQDTAGPMARNVADVTVLLSAMIGLGVTGANGGIVDQKGGAEHPPECADPSAVRHLRLGVLESLTGSSQVSGASEVSEVFQGAVERLQRIGAVVTSTPIPNLSNRLKSTSLYLNRSRSDLDLFLASRTGFEVNSVSEIYERGEFHQALDLFEAIALSSTHTSEIERRRICDERDSLRSDVLRAMQLNQASALCFPTVQTTPPSHDEVLSRKWSSLEYPTNTTLASHTGLPALTVPIGFTASGFPVGIELLGRPFQERTLLAIGSEIERVFSARTSPKLSI